MTEALKADIDTIINGAKKADKLEVARTLWKIMSHYGNKEAAKYIWSLMEEDPIF